jgi:hypothetical protein
MLQALYDMRISTDKSLHTVEKVDSLADELHHCSEASHNGTGSGHLNLQGSAGGIEHMGYSELQRAM